MRQTSTNILYGTYMIPVKIGNHNRSNDGSGLKLACPKCTGDVGVKNYCKECSYEPERSECSKCFKDGEDKYVFSREQLEGLESESIIEVLGVIDKDSIDIRAVIGSYCINPTISKKKIAPTKVAKPWKALLEAMKTSDKAIAVRFTNNSKERLGYITVINGEMEMIVTSFAEDFNESDEPIPEINVSEGDVQMASTFLNSLQEIEPDTIIDGRREKVRRVVETGEPITVEVQEQESEMSFFAQ